jgi:hypothetical protein
LSGETVDAVVTPDHGGSRAYDECGRVRNAYHRAIGNAADSGYTDARIGI